jgi:hypothetical protein
MVASVGWPVDDDQVLVDHVTDQDADDAERKIEVAGSTVLYAAGTQPTVPTVNRHLVWGVLVGLGRPHVGCLKACRLPFLQQLHLRVRRAPTVRAGRRPAG